MECVHRNIVKSATNVRRTAVAKPMPMKEIIDFFNVFTKKNASHKLYEHFSDHQYTFLIIQTLCRPSGSFSDHPNISRSPGHFPDYSHSGFVRMIQIIPKHSGQPAGQPAKTFRICKNFPVSIVDPLTRFFCPFCLVEAV